MVKIQNKYLPRSENKDQKYRIIKALLYFRERKKPMPHGSKQDDLSNEKLEPNLKDEYYDKKIKGKKSKYTIIKDFKREDGWMDYKSLSEESDINPQAIGDKIKPLIKARIIEREQITWKHYKNPNRVFSKYVYRLIHDGNTLDYIYNLIESEKEKITAHYYLRLCHDKNKSLTQKREEYLKKEQFENENTINTDYFTIVPLKIRLKWFNGVCLYLKMEKVAIERKLNNLQKLNIKLNKEVKNS